MDEDKITITDSTYREPANERLERELKEYGEEKLRRAEEKENEMLEKAWERSVKRAERRKNFFAAIKNIFVKKNNDIQRNNDQNQR